jgi:two-component system response regulator AtoC
VGTGQLARGQDEITSAVRVLLVDDDREWRELLCARLRSSRRVRYEPVPVSSAEEALRLIAEDLRGFELVLTDVRMRELNGLALCERLACNHPALPVLVMTAWASVETVVGALRAGACDFLVKPVELEDLERALQRALRRRVARSLEAQPPASPAFGELIGGSAPMRALFEQLAQLVGVDTSVLLTGESGTGKELVARALHRHGPRRDGPFVAINCAAMPEALLESQLFGHVRGAFTGAETASVGLLVQASGGTLLLDELGDMPLSLQPKLLRALQERRVRPVGGNSEVPFDIRLIASTNRAIEADVASGRFRSDLFYRINVIQLALPPLRARGSDVLLLARAALASCAQRACKPIEGLTSATAERLLCYSWPGNVRELQNCIERAVAFARGPQLTVEDLPERLRDYADWRAMTPPPEPQPLLSMEELERQHILRVMAAVQGNKASAARILGLDRKTLYRRLRSYRRGGAQLQTGGAIRGGAADAGHAG